MKVERNTRRNTADGILAAVDEGGRMQFGTLEQLFGELARAGMQFHLVVEVRIGPILKTIDNERDATETIRRLKKARKARAARR